jgi:hypothetical protein
MYSCNTIPRSTHVPTAAQVAAVAAPTIKLVATTQATTLTAATAAAESKLEIQDYPHLVQYVIVRDC